MFSLKKIGFITVIISSIGMCALTTSGADMDAFVSIDSINSYLSGVVNNTLTTTNGLGNVTGGQNLLSGSTAASIMNDRLREIVNQAVVDGTIDTLNLGGVSNGMCVGYTPSGNGVLMRVPTNPEKTIVWTYSPVGYQNNLSCNWTCAAGYTRNSNGCELLTNMNQNQPSPSEVIWVDQSKQTNTVQAPVTNQNRDTNPTTGINQNNPVKITPSLTVPTYYENGILAWQRAHRNILVLGFRWEGLVANYITQEMYAGTPIKPGVTSVNSMSNETRANAYKTCLESEFSESFGANNNPEFTDDTTEMKAIAKHCVRDAYGEYFYGKDYTTREEFFLMISTLFGDGETIPGQFLSKTQYANDIAVHTSYTNLASTAWYVPFVNEGAKLGISDTDNTWKIASEISANDVYILFKNLAAKQGTPIIPVDNIANIRGNDGKIYRVTFDKTPILHITQN